MVGCKSLNFDVNTFGKPSLVCRDYLNAPGGHFSSAGVIRTIDGILREIVF